MFLKKTMSEIRELIGNVYIYFVVDETTNTCGRYIANLLIGVLSENVPGQAYLIGLKQLEKTNNVTMSQFINEVLTSFYLPNAVPTEKVLLMLSDAAT